MLQALNGYWLQMPWANRGNGPAGLGQWQQSMAFQKNYQAANARRAAQALAQKINAAVAGQPETFAVWAPLIVAAMRGCGGSVWQAYDDACGNCASWVGEAGYMARQVRNHPVWCRALMNSIDGRD